MLASSDMNVGMYNSATSMASLQRWQDVVSQNIASGSVPGFKKNEVSFEAISAGIMGVRQDGRVMSTPATMAIATTSVNYQQGQVQQTEESTHMALASEGFFRVQGQGYEYYTRDGEFHFDPQGQLVNKSGHVVMGQGGPIQRMPDEGDITVLRNGMVLQGDNTIGVMDVVDVPDRSALLRVPGGFRIDPESAVMPVQVEDPGLLQGNLEISNVSPLTEMVNLISISRAFEANQKVIQSLDTLEGRSIEVLGAVN